MWTCLNDAFVSVVAYKPGAEPRLEKHCDRRGKNLLLVRVRTQKHADHLIDRGLNATFMERPGHDYRFGTLVPKAAYATFMAEQVMGIDYGNFKGSVRDNPLHDAYMDVWTVMNRMQATRRHSAYSFGSAWSEPDLFHATDSFSVDTSQPAAPSSADGADTCVICKTPTSGVEASIFCDQHEGLSEDVKNLIESAYNAGLTDGYEDGYDDGAVAAGDPPF
jgi:hypothetical protein